nr:hypothetical protein CFP56_17014 [Quercus suber]
MASTRTLQKTLPHLAPNSAHHRNTLDGLKRYKFSIFSLVSRNATELRQLEDAINSGEFSTRRSTLAPQPNFGDRSLKDVYDYHIRIRDEDDSIHPLYFIVADSKDPVNDGVIVVLLNAGQDEDDLVGVGRCGLDMADSWGTNIDIGNQDWLDLKEEEADQWHGPDPKVSKTYIHSSCLTTTKPTAAVPINSMLEPDWLKMKPGQSRFQMLGNYHSSSDAWSEIRTAHPRQCAVRPAVHRTLILVVQQENANEAEAISLVRLEWDGDTSNVEGASPAVKPEVAILRKFKAQDALQEIDSAAQEIGSSGT